MYQVRVFLVSSELIKAGSLSESVVPFALLGQTPEGEEGRK